MNHEGYMHRCIQLAALGMGKTSPNPIVGAVLVYDEKIIGEGYHKLYGEPHAEVNAIEDAFKNGYSHLISASTLYVSLEPCSHFGKTPPCTDLIVRYKIPRVVIGCRDPNRNVEGKGAEKLRDAGIEVVTGILEKECKAKNARFFSFHQQKRPYVILKWAQSADGFMASVQGAPRLFISDELVNRLVHKWRSEEDSILIGANTAL